MLCAAASITVFINGVVTEVPRGPINLRSMFGQDVLLVHSTGGVLPVNEYGILMQSLQMGESYFLVSSNSLVNFLSIFVSTTSIT
jgi:hypothetical protein